MCIVYRYIVLRYTDVMNRQSTNLLPHVSFSILFALSIKPRHGYELMQQIEDDSDGRVKLGPGTLYGALKQLHEDTLIEELPFENEHTRRRYYRITRKGLSRLTADVVYYRKISKLANDRQLS